MERPSAQTCIPTLNSSHLVINRCPAALLHQTTAVTIRKSHFSGSESTQVAVLSFRSCHAKKRHFWDATVRLLEQDVLRQPQHPNLVSVIALAKKERSVDVGGEDTTTTTPDCVVMELMPTSLFDALHVDGMKLSRSDILFIAMRVLDGLSFLHRLGLSFGSTLTSRKVMLGGTCHVKLRRFCSERIRREAGVVQMNPVTNSATSQYVMPRSECASESTLQHAQRSDLYAFGMLLLEMCTAAKPNREMCNSISLAGQIDPHFELIIQATLGVGSPSQLLRDDVKHDDPHALMGFCARLLSECVRDDALSSSEQKRRSCNRFGSFLHADRYFLECEANRVEQQLAERLNQSTVALKRLAAVEEDLVEEQRNFEVVVRQLEQLRIEKAADERHIQTLAHKIAELEGALLSKDNEVTTSRVKLEESRSQQEELSRNLYDLESRLKRAKEQRTLAEGERQSLAIEVLRLKDEKRICVDEKLDIARQLANMASKVGGEKDAIEELEARYRQATHRCEQEQKSCRATEKKLEALARQLASMEEERSRYCGALQIAPTGTLDARSSKFLVLELKEKEVQSLHDENRALSVQLADTIRELRRSEADCSRLEQTICPKMQAHIDQLSGEINRVNATVADLHVEKELLQSHVAEANKLAEDFQSTISTLETQVCELQKQVADAERAKRLRQCLTPNCDAPRYLVKASGFCVDCEENMSKERGKSRSSISTKSSTPLSPSRGRTGHGHRRQRSLDGITATLNNTKNVPIMDLLKQVEVARDVDDEASEESSLELVALMKQLGKLLKQTESLKEDLPECGALRSIVSVMGQFIGDLPVILECCKTLSIVVFNHDRNRLILVSEGVVELLLQMLRTFPLEVQAQEVGAVLLTNLAHNCESNRQRILAAGGVDAILEMMQTFPRDCGVQKRSCWALLTLAGSDFMCDKIAALGGVGATLAAMLNCPQDEDVQHYGCWALLNLVSGTKHVQDFARREGVVEVVEAALTCFPENVDIQEKCRDILELVHQTEEM